MTEREYFENIFLCVAILIIIGISMYLAKCDDWKCRQVPQPQPIEQRC